MTKINYRSNLITVTLLLIFSFASSLSRASGLSLRAGLNLPTSSGLRTDVPLAFGADYHFSRLVKPKDGGPAVDSSISLDYFKRGDYGHYPVLINVMLRKGSIYGGLGAGVGVIRQSGEFANLEFAAAATIGTDLQLGQTRLFVEGKYFIVSDKIQKGSITQANDNGFGAYIGFRL